MVTVDDESEVAAFKDFVVDAVSLTSSPPVPSPAPASAPVPVPVPASAAGAIAQASTVSVTVPSGGRVFASPLARKLAKESNVNISSVKGTGTFCLQ